MLLRRILRLLLEPAKDPLHDSLAAALERVSALHTRLDQELAGLRARTASLQDPTLRDQVEGLEAEQGRLREIEQRLAGELNSYRARTDLVSARQTAFQAQLRLAELMTALDAAQARASALAPQDW